ncbi:unnamed protein product, partial [Prorocentrum cordatum]
MDLEDSLAEAIDGALGEGQGDADDAFTAALEGVLEGEGILPTGDAAAQPAAAEAAAVDTAVDTTVDTAAAAVSAAVGEPEGAGNGEIGQRANLSRCILALPRCTGSWAPPPDQPCGQVCTRFHKAPLLSMPSPGASGAAAARVPPKRGRPTREQRAAAEPGAFDARPTVAAGVLVTRLRGGVPELLAIGRSQDAAGPWEFPKGRLDFADGSELGCAFPELTEEAGLGVSLPTRGCQKVGVEEYQTKTGSGPALDAPRGQRAARASRGQRARASDASPPADQLGDAEAPGDGAPGVCGAAVGGSMAGRGPEARRAPGRASPRPADDRADGEAGEDTPCRGAGPPSPPLATREGCVAAGGNAGGAAADGDSGAADGLVEAAAASLRRSRRLKASRRRRRVALSADLIMASAAGGPTLLERAAVTAGAQARHGQYPDRFFSHSSLSDARVAILVDENSDCQQCDYFTAVYSGATWCRQLRRPELASEPKLAPAEVGAEELALHQLRHSGASIEACKRDRKLEQVRGLGCWAQAKGMRRYERRGRLGGKRKKCPRCISKAVKAFGFRARSWDVLHDPARQNLLDNCVAQAIGPFVSRPGLIWKACFSSGSCVAASAAARCSATVRVPCSVTPCTGIPPDEAVAQALQVVRRVCSSLGKGQSAAPQAPAADDGDLENDVDTPAEPAWKAQLEKGLERLRHCEAVGAALRAAVHPSFEAATDDLRELGPEQVKALRDELLKLEKVSNVAKALAVLKDVRAMIDQSALLALRAAEQARLETALAGSSRTIAPAAQATRRAPRRGPPPHSLRRSFSFL